MRCNTNVTVFLGNIFFGYLHHSNYRYQKYTRLPNQLDSKMVSANGFYFLTSCEFLTTKSSFLIISFLELQNMSELSSKAGVHIFYRGIGLL